MSSSLNIAVTHAISFLTRPLVGKYSHATIDRLHAALEEQLTAYFRPSWVESDPSYGSDSRVLHLGPTRIPPSAVWRSGTAAGVQWSDWIKALGGFEFDLYVDPGRVAFSIGAWAESLSGFHVIWEMDRYGGSPIKRKTLAQSIVDDEEDLIFNLIDNEVSAPSLVPILDQFPTVPISLESPYLRPTSRASSSSSSGSSGFYFSSSDSDAASVSSMSTPSSCRSSLDLPPIQPTPAVKPVDATKRHSRSRRSRGRLADVFIDSSKTEVTNYDGGKTKVLTGGVMLGAPAPTKSKVNSRQPTGDNWRHVVSTGRW